MASKKALLFVNGEPPNTLPTDTACYDIIACTDGAYSSYLSDSGIPMNYIIGDLDSLEQTKQSIPQQTQVIITPDQNKTDFEKAILFLADKGIAEFDIYGASGRATDHFLGNLSVAMRYYKQYKFTFYDNYGYFFFANPYQVISHANNKTISLIALSVVDSLTLTGFKYPLINETLSLGGLASLRNEAIEDKVTISFKNGDLLVLISTER